MDSFIDFFRQITTGLKVWQSLIIKALPLAAVSVWLCRKAWNRWVSKPRLSVAPHESNPITRPFQTQEDEKDAPIVDWEGRVLEVIVYNRTRKIPYFGWEIVKTATACEGVMEFFCSCSGERVGDPVPMRWADSGKPWLQSKRIGIIAAPQQIERKRNITPGGTEVLDVVVQRLGEKYCFAWTDRSHTEDDFSFILREGLYKLKITISSDQGVWHGYFSLINQPWEKGLRLDPSQPF